jgi:YfiH family protein
MDAARGGGMIRPSWRVAGVGALMSTRAGGVSGGRYASLNLGRAVGDDPAAVAENRRRFVAGLGSKRGAGPAVRPVWLHQVHGTRVLHLTDRTPEHPPEHADAAWTDRRGLACLIGAADCLPVLLAADDGRAVAAAHAGWRGLAAGVLEATVAALREGAGAPAQRLLAWIGPGIGPAHFEVGADVLAAFGASASAHDGPRLARFRWRPRPDGAPRWLADLPALAEDRLRAAGVERIETSGLCTASDASRFFSFRRDGVTGRMAAAIWLE